MVEVDGFKDLIQERHMCIAQNYNKENQHYILLFVLMAMYIKFVVFAEVAICCQFAYAAIPRPDLFANQNNIYASLFASFNYQKLYCILFIIKLL